MSQIVAVPTRRSAVIRRAVGALFTTLLVTSVLMSTGRASGPIFDAPVLLRGSSNASEPVIKIAPDGSIFVSPIFGIPTHSPMWRSTDGGLTFKQLTFQAPYNRLPGGGDSDVVVVPHPNGQTNRVYFLDLWLGSNSISVSEDNGTTWTRGTPITSLPLSDRQWMAVGERDPKTGLDTVFVIYRLVNQPGWVMVARSRDGGMTWDHHARVVSNSGRYPPGQLVGDGKKFLITSYVKGGNLHTARSSDEGATWDDGAATYEGNLLDGSMASITRDPITGDLYMPMVDVDRQVLVTKSTDNGESWSWPTLVSAAVGEPDAGSNVFPWIAARNGKVAVAWYGTEDWTGDPNGATGANWFVEYVESIDGGQTWTSETHPIATPARVGHICTLGLSCQSGRDLGDFMQLTINDAGLSVLATVSPSGTLVTTQCRETGCA